MPQQYGTGIADPIEMYAAYQVALDGAPGWRFNGMASVTTSVKLLKKFPPAQK